MKGNDVILSKMAGPRRCGDGPSMVKGGAVYSKRRGSGETGGRERSDGGGFEQENCCALNRRNSWV